MTTKSLEIEVRVWYDADKDRIKIAGPGLKAYSISNNPSAPKRYHPVLFARLADLLRAHGKPAP
ncbi:MAG TPA: hypothetical protein VG943_09005 [Caulobacterales bacterium]|nr:hypothetical protein [Caulobacterales bacterium]